jgi:hypothetical protein
MIPVLILQISATLVTPLSVGRRSFDHLKQTMNGEGRTVAWSSIGQNRLEFVFVLKKDGKHHFHCFFCSGFKNVCSHLFFKGN